MYNFKALITRKELEKSEYLKDDCFAIQYSSVMSLSAFTKFSMFELGLRNIPLILLGFESF